MQDTDFGVYLRASSTIEANHPAIAGFAQAHTVGATDPTQQAVKLYYAVRDGIRYDPYIVDLSPEKLRASTTLGIGRGWCVSKAILLAACCRALEIPARLGFADVRNHLSTARMRQQMETDVFYWHGYTSIYLDSRWVKATPAFNVELCDRFKILPLEFDGREDSIYHLFDLEGRRHMEYLRYRGEYAEAPVEEMLETFSKAYPAMTDSPSGADFDAEVAQETR